MALNPRKIPFLDRVLGRIGRLDQEGLQTVVQRLVRERTFLETLFNAIEDGVLVVDEKGRVIYLNAGVTRLLGITAENAEGQQVSRLVPGIDWKRLSQIDLEGGASGSRHEIEITYPSRRFLRVYATPLDGEENGRSGVALVLHDATELRQKTSEAIESERVHALTLLAASVAHEIGNPLNALHIHLQLMERDLKKLKVAVADNASSGGKRRSALVESDPSPGFATIIAKLENYVSVAEGEIQRLDYIISEFLQALRPKAPQMEPTRLDDVIRQTLDLLGPEFANRGIEILDLSTPSLPPCSCDPAQMKQVLVNLAKNAMQAMNRGGRFTITTGATEDDIWVSLADNGTGIPAEQQRRIFEPYYTTKVKGTGLGLMIVERIMRDHNGRVELVSQVGKGTTFRLWLPRPDRGPKLIGDIVNTPS